MNPNPHSTSQSPRPSHPLQAASSSSHAASPSQPRCHHHSFHPRSHPPKTVDTRRPQTRYCTKCSTRHTGCKPRRSERDFAMWVAARTPDQSSTSPQSRPSLPPSTDMTTRRFPVQSRRHHSSTRKSSHPPSRASIPRARTASDGLAVIACAVFPGLA